MPDVGALAWPVRLSGESYAISIAGPVYRIEPHLRALRGHPARGVRGAGEDLTLAGGRI